LDHQINKKISISPPCELSALLKSQANSLKHTQTPVAENKEENKQTIPSYKERKNRGKNLYAEKILFKIRPSAKKAPSSE
jgi:hypothetical protein